MAKSGGRGRDGKNKFYKTLTLDRITKKFISIYRQVSRVLQNETK